VKELVASELKMPMVYKQPNNGQLTNLCH